MGTLDEQAAARQALSEAIQDTYPSMGAEMHMRHLRAMAVGLDRRGFAVAPIDMTDVVIGPIQHSPSLCRKPGCECWCAGCETHRAEPDTLDVAIERAIASMVRTGRWSDSDARTDLAPIITAAASIAALPRS